MILIKCIVLELLSSFASTTRTVGNAQKTSEFILKVFHVSLESYGLYRFSYLPIYDCIVDNEYIVLELLTSFASASEKQKRSGTLRKRLSSS